MNKNLDLIRFLSLIIFIAIFLYSIVNKNNVLNLVFTKVEAASFTFTAAGDYGGGTRATANLNAIKNSGANFNIALGDFRYDSQSSPAGWGTYVKGILGSNYPFQLISGNHDDQDIAAYVSALPDRIGGITGEYGKQYYFDYPTSSPIARFILISPGLFSYKYTVGTSNYNFVSTAIDSARSKGIKWIFVGMHKNCVTSGIKSCEIGMDIMNLMVSKKVDVILQGHDHNVQRSKQLKCIKSGSYDSSCVVNSGNSLTKDAGTVLIINGAGGNGLYAVSTSDSEYNYFASANGSTYGISKFVVSDNQLQYSFVPTSGSFADSFTITGSGVIPTTGSTNPTITQGTGSSTKVALTLNLHGIGNGGDNVSPNSTGNTNPLNKSKSVALTLTDSNNNALPAKQGTVTYNSTAGNFQGTIDLGTTFTSGPYIAKVKIPKYLVKSYPGIQTITKGQTVQLSTVALIVGDSNNDNSLSVLDYNYIVDCFADIGQPKNCADQTKKTASDLNDDGNVNQFDYNLFLRELSVQSGQ